jgi:hypothetical protein
MFYEADHKSNSSKKPSTTPRKQHREERANQTAKQASTFVRRLSKAF